MKIRFELSISGRDDGTLEAAYITLRNTKVQRTEEIERNAMTADYDSQGNLVGVEILAPVRLSNIAKLADATVRPRFRKFVRHSAPREFVLV